MRAAITIKAAIVAQDLKEADLRVILNFGHTVGHAVEDCMQPQLLHGECVAIGMVAESRIAISLGLDVQDVTARLARCLQRSAHP